MKHKKKWATPVGLRIGMPPNHADHYVRIRNAHKWSRHPANLLHSQAQLVAVGSTGGKRP